MFLIVDLFDAKRGKYTYLDAIPYDVAGDQYCRKKLWGSQSLIARNAKYFPQLNVEDLHVMPQELDKFADECQMVNDESTAIAVEVYQDERKAKLIEEYVARVVYAIQAARDHGRAGVCIS